ncbi:hypothetical protein Scep_014032 [Stephania cephalantha]|uniref:Uncharacterized protein n=1 Tax=Stephania cephalantha TaxID=152367 RepID=A0AAP0P2L4_9MAGN
MCRLWMEGSHKLVISWHLILATGVCVLNMRNFKDNNFRFLMQTTLCFIPLITSSVDEDAKEKLAPYSALSGDESYSNRDLEKVAELIGFQRCMHSCLEYLEAVPWVGDEEEEKVLLWLL